MPMHPFFIAHGPLFKRKFIGDPFDNVDLFPLVCKMMRIKVPPNNGTYANVKSLLALTGAGFAVGSPVGWAIGKKTNKILENICLKMIFLRCWTYIRGYDSSGNFIHFGFHSRTKKNCVSRRDKCRL
jgi:hypothetical protein